MVTEADIRKNWESRSLPDIEGRLQRAIQIADCSRNKDKNTWTKEDKDDFLWEEVLLQIVREKKTTTPSIPTGPQAIPTNNTSSTREDTKVNTEVTTETKQLPTLKTKSEQGIFFVLATTLVLMLVAGIVIFIAGFFTNGSSGFLIGMTAILAVIIGILVTSILMTPSEKSSVVVQKTSKKWIWTFVTTAVIVLGMILWLTSDYWLGWLKVGGVWVAGIVGLTILGLVAHFTRKDDKVFGMIKWVVGAAIFLIVAYKIGELAGNGIDAVKELAKRPAPQQVALKPKVTLETAFEKKTETLTLLPGEKKRVLVPKWWYMDWDIKDDVVLWVNGTRRIFDSASDRTPIDLGKFVDCVDFENPHKTKTIQVEVALYK